MPRKPAPPYQDQALPQGPAAKVIGVAEASLEKDRTDGRLGVPYHKVGHKIVYLLSDLLAYLETCRRVPPVRADLEHDRSEQPRA